MGAGAWPRTVGMKIANARTMMAARPNEALGIPAICLGDLPLRGGKRAKRPGISLAASSLSERRTKRRREIWGGNATGIASALGSCFFLSVPVIFYWRFRIYSGLGGRRIRHAAGFRGPRLRPRDYARRRRKTAAEWAGRVKRQPGGWVRPVELDHGTSGPEMQRCAPAGQGRKSEINVSSNSIPYHFPYIIDPFLSSFSFHC